MRTLLFLLTLGFIAGNGTTIKRTRKMHKLKQDLDEEMRARS